MAIKPVAQWTTYQDVKAAVDAGLPQDYDTCRRLVEEGDHWLSGEGWIGHRTGDAVVDSALRVRVEPQFVADDVIGELVENRTSGLIGQEADITLDPLKPIEEEKAATATVQPTNGATPPPPDPAALEAARLRAEKAKADQREEIDGILGALAKWWDSKRLQEKVDLAADRVSWARRGAVWPYVPDGNLSRMETAVGTPVRTLPTGKTLAEALDLVEVDAPAPNTATRYTDPVTGRSVAIILTKIGEQERAQVWSVNPDTKQTEVRVFVQGGGTPAGMATAMSGRLPFGEMQGKRLVTPSLRRSQALLNFIMTVTGRTVETAGFRERYIINAEPELLWLNSPPASTPVVKTHKDDSGRAILWGVRMPRTLGAGLSSEIIGLEIPAKEGQPQQVLEPNVTALDPVDPAFATNAADAVTLRLYKRGKQGHLGLAKTGETSGTAYQQARAQFESDLRRLKSPCEGLIRDVLEGALALAGAMSEEARSILARYRVVVNLRISAGPIAPEEADLAIRLRDAGVISPQSAMARVGVEDPDAEQEAIDADQLAGIDKLLETLRRSPGGPRSPTLEAHLIYAAADGRGLIPPGMEGKIKAELQEAAQASIDRAEQMRDLLEDELDGDDGGGDDDPPGRTRLPRREPASAGNGSEP